jgi:hypothetical protein
MVLRCSKRSSQIREQASITAMEILFSYKWNTEGMRLVLIKYGVRKKQTRRKKNDCLQSNKQS